MAITTCVGTLGIPIMRDSCSLHHLTIALGQNKGSSTHALRQTPRQPGEEGVRPERTAPLPAPGLPHTNAWVVAGCRYLHLYFLGGQRTAPLQENGAQVRAHPRLQPRACSDTCQQAPHTGRLAEETSSSRRTPQSFASPSGGSATLPESPRAEGSGWPLPCSCYSAVAPAGRTRTCTTSSHHGKGRRSQSRLASKSLLNHREQEVYSRPLKARRDQEEQPALPPARSPLPRPAAMTRAGCCSRGFWPFAATGNNSQQGKARPQPARFRLELRVLTNSFPKASRGFSNPSYFRPHFIRLLPLRSFNWLHLVPCHYKAPESRGVTREPGGTRSRGSGHNHLQRP